MVSKLTKKKNQSIISLEEAKEHLRILHSHEDVYLSSLLYVVTETLESELGKDLVDTDYKLTVYEGIEVGVPVLLADTPVVKVLGVQFFNADILLDGVAMFTITDGSVIFDELPEIFDRLDVSYKRGYEDKDDVPTPIMQAALLVLADLYMNRGTFVVGRSVIYLQKTVDRLLQPYRKIKFI